MKGESVKNKILSYWREESRRPTAAAFLIFLAGLNFLIWDRIVFSAAGPDILEIYSLAVGQGDSQLIRLPGGVKLLIDGGPPTGGLLSALADVLPANDRRIDLVMISHPQLDHFGGLVELVKRYDVGLILTNGQESSQPAYQALTEAAEEKTIRFLPLAQGDSVIYDGSRLDVFWPPANRTSVQDPNDDALVVWLAAKNATTLFTGDIPAAIEKRVAAWLPGPADVLKVAHHGSKNSSAADFLAAIRPKVSLIGVGKNSYGHPAPATLERLAAAGSTFYRTDLDGTVKLVIDGRKIEIFKEGVDSIE